ncbi:MAG: putative molybdenum carrier protein, partial [Nitrospira sp.]|nr:putative molybdenum carrier protein [Nitrospira sp.]
NFCMKIKKPVKRWWYPSENYSSPIKLSKVRDEVRNFILEHNIKTLNVAGNRASTNHGIYDYVYSVMHLVLGETKW